MTSGVDLLDEVKFDSQGQTTTKKSGLDLLDEVTKAPEAPVAPIPPAKPTSTPAPFVGLEIGQLMRGGPYPGTPVPEKPKAPAGPGLVTTPEQSILDKIKSWWYTPDVTNDEAANVMAMSKMTGMAPMDVFRHYDELSNIMFPGSTPHDKMGRAKAVAKVGMDYLIATGLATHPAATLLGLGTFFGLDELENAGVSMLKNKPYEFQAGQGISDLLNAEGFSRDALDMFDFAWKVPAAGATSKIGRGLMGTVVSKVTGKEGKMDLINKIARRWKETGKSPDDIVKEEGDSLGIDADALKRAHDSVLEMEEVQRKLEPDMYDKWIKEDLSLSGKQIESIKQKKSQIADEVIDKAMRSLKEPKPPKEEAPKSGIDLIEPKGPTEGELIDGYFSLKDKETPLTKLREEIEGMGKGVVFIPEPEIGNKTLTISSLFIPKDERGKGTGAKIINRLNEFADEYGITLKGQGTGVDVDRPLIDFYKKYGWSEVGPNVVERKPMKKAGVVTRKYGKADDIDFEVTLSEPLRMTTKKSPFRTNAKKTAQLSKLYAEREKAVNEDVEMFTSKLINDVNRWLEGEDINIETVRGNLSELAARADQLRFNFDMPENFRSWKTTISDAAKWARQATRKKGEPTGTTLNMMIPLDKLPSAVKKILEKSKGIITFEGLYRNDDIYRETGCWLAKDGMWRFEIDDSGMVFKDSFIKDNSRFMFKDMWVTKKSQPTPIKDVIDHPTLLEFLDDFIEGKTLKVVIDRNLKFGGEYVPTENLIRLKSLDLSILAHEVQHVVNRATRSTFLGTNEFVERTRLQIRELADRLEPLIDIAKDPEVVEMAKHFVSRLRADAEGPNPSPGVVDWFEKSVIPFVGIREGMDVAKRLSRPVGDYSEESFMNYLREPGEMEARLAAYKKTHNFKEPSSTPPWKMLDKMLEEDVRRYGLRSYESKGFVEAGHKLYSGVPLDVATKKLVEGAKKVSDYVKRAQGMKELKFGEAARALKNELNRAFVDRSGNIRKELLEELGDEGYKIVQKMYLSRGASALSANMLKQMRKEIYEGLSKDEKRILDTLILAYRMIDIGKYKSAKEFKFPEGLDPINAVTYSELFQFIEKLSPERAEMIRDKAQSYFEWMKKPLEDMRKAGLISEEEFNLLSEHNYRRLKLVDIFDKRYQTKIGKRKRTVYDSGVEALAHGRDTDIFEPSSEIMALEVFNRAYGRILNNEANKTLLDLARSQPENSFVRVKEKKGDRIPTGWDRIFMYENGERKALYLSPEMSREWITNNPEMSYRLGQLIRYASGSPILRTFATGINWGFALANVPRDVMHSWFAARIYEDGQWKSLYSSTFPVFAMQMARDQASVFTDALLRKGRYEDYIKEGGGMEFLVHQGRLFQRGRHLEGPIDKAYDFLGYFGETSEIMTRLAIRERAMRRGKLGPEATFAARDYMDFGQGGGVTKALDNGIPYLNATIQGTRGLFRAIKDKPLESSYKLAQLAAMTTGIYVAMQAMHPESSKALRGSIDMQNNVCIPIGDDFGFIDSQGQMRYPYLKIPLDPGQKFFKTFFEAAADKWLGNPVDVDRVTGSLKEMSPVGTSSLPPSISGVLGYVTNKDFWLNEDIWKKSDKPFSWPKSKEEFIPGQTPQSYIDFGAATGMSPERTKHMVQELTTNGTVWSYLLGAGYDAIFSDMPKSQKEKHLAEVLSKVPMVKRFFGITNPYSQHAANVEAAKESAEVDRWIQNRGLDMRADAYLFDKSIPRSDIFKYINSFKDLDTMRRLRDRFEFQEKTKDLPNRSFWLSLKGISDTDKRAEVYVNRVKSSTPEERAQLHKELAIVINAGGIISEDFRKAVIRLNAK